MSVAEAETAVAAATVAQKRWAALSCNQRSAVIRGWAQRLTRHRESLAQLITAENGKTLSDARAEVASGVAALEWYAEEARRTLGSMVPPLVVGSSERRQLIHHQPVGVVGVITPVR